MKTKTSFWPVLEALEALPVPQTLEVALALGLKQETPPPRRSVPVQLPPTTVDLDDDLAASLALLRPRDRKWTVGETCGGVGRHGRGKGEEEEMHHETLDEEAIVVDGLDALSVSAARAAASVGDEVVDQGVEDPLQVDLPLHLHR